MNTQELGITAAELMDSIETEYGPKDDVTVGVVAVIAEVTWSDGDDEYTSVEYRCSEGKRWIQAGLFDAAKRATGLTPREEPEE